jgi:hypothetical protein
LHRHGRGGQHRAFAIQQRCGAPQRPQHVAAGALGERQQHQVAQRMSREITALEAMRQHVGQFLLACQRQERHPQVAERDDAQLAAQPAARTAVVRGGDHRGRCDMQAARRQQHTRQPVASANGYNVRHGGHPP